MGAARLAPRAVSAGTGAGGGTGDTARAATAATVWSACTTSSANRPAPLVVAAVGVIAGFRLDSASGPPYFDARYGAACLFRLYSALPTVSRRPTAERARLDARN